MPPNIHQRPPQHQPINFDMSVLSQTFQEKSTCFGVCGDTTTVKYDWNNKLIVDKDGLTKDDQQKKQEIDKMLSQALNGLTFEERQEQQEVLHGVDDKIKEEATFIDSTLEELDMHINHTKSGSPAYETAERMDPGYVQARSLRLMFLRGNWYDPKAAADQMLRFFGQKQKMFGTSKLTKDITIDDLDEDDIECLKTGCVQMAGKDRSNRQIFVQLPGLRAFQTLMNEMRTLYFVTMQALKSEQTQLYGSVCVMYSVGEFRDCKSGQGFLENARVGMSVPIKLAANHVCYSELAEYLLCNVVFRTFPVELRARCPLHFGSHVECQYRLSTYGITPSMLPLVPHTNKVDNSRHLRWVQQCLDEAQSSGKTMPLDDQHMSFIVPNPNDVLYHGGKKVNNEGNKYLRNLVRDLSQIYDLGSNERKRVVVDGMIAKVHQRGGRFLIRQKGEELPIVWEELPLDRIRIKVMQAFRNQRRKQ